MDWIWITEPNYIFGYNKNIVNNYTDINHAYLFDLDYTLIKPKSGKKFPISKTDWELLYPNIPDMLNNLVLIKKSLIGIVSNQKGLNNHIKISEWIEKCDNIRIILPDIHFIFASLKDDRFRKPLCGSNELIKSTFVNINWNYLETLNKIYYIGDAFGRINDFSDTDYKYAINSKFKFKTPELLFKIKNSDKSGTITYPQINYFTELEQTNIFEQLAHSIQSNNKIFIIIMGLPASGKSFIRKEIIKRFPQFVYTNNDDINNKIQSNSLVKKISTNYNYIIDDNTNLIKNDRINKMKHFVSYYKIGIWFDLDLKICHHLNWLRMYWFGQKLLPNVIYNTLNKKMTPENLPNHVEFDKFIQIQKIFREFNLDNSIKYYF